MKKFLKISVIVLCVLFLLVNVAGAIGGYYLYNLALNPNFDKSSVIDADHNEVDYSSMEEAFDEGREWFGSVDYFSLYQNSSDGLLLHAFGVENELPADTWVIICHGYASTGYTMVGQASLFYARGYNVLMPDARGCGHSEGDYIGMGWHDRFDLIGWIDEINELYAPKNIILYGVSMGGATVMMASGETLPENVRAIIEDCGYSSVQDEFSYQLYSLFGLPSFPLLNYASLVAQIEAGFWFGEASALEQVAKSVTPTLFIHGDEDTFVPSSMLDLVYDAAACEKEKLLIEGAGHGGAAFTDEVLYWSTVDNFIARYLV